MRTLIVVPTLLTGHAAIKELVERLEVHYLANLDGALRFALLSDWVDAPDKRLPGDDKLLAAAVEGIASSNDRHGPARRALFSVPSQAGLERMPARMDGVGTQTRKAA
jgi:cyclic beta-1,2-glucan synthetase